MSERKTGFTEITETVFSDNSNVGLVAKGTKISANFHIPIGRDSTIFERRVLLQCSLHLFYINVIVF